MLAGEMKIQKNESVAAVLLVVAALVVGLTTYDYGQIKTNDVVATFDWSPFV